MRISLGFITSLKIQDAKDRIDGAVEKSIKDTVRDIAADVIKGSPWLTGNNARSVKFEVGPGGEVAKNEKEGAVYSTSGYGGFLETGTSIMAARPYFKPALDKHIMKLPQGIKAELK